MVLTYGARFRDDLLAWAEDNTRSFPWRDSEATLYEVFMSEMFLRRTRADVVERFIPEFFTHYPDLESLRTAEKDDLAEVIRPMGLQNRRATGLIELATELAGRDIPQDREALTALPQVGPYVANATLCFALGKQLPIIDRNVDRIYRRVFDEEWADLSEAKQWKVAAELLPEGEARRYNLALLDFAALVCTAPEPRCDRCFATSYCGYYHDVVQMDDYSE